MSESDSESLARPRRMALARAARGPGSVDMNLNKICHLNIYQRPVQVKALAGGSVTVCSHWQRRRPIPLADFRRYRLDAVWRFEHGKYVLRRHQLKVPSGFEVPQGKFSTALSHSTSRKIKL